LVSQLVMKDDEWEITRDFRKKLGFKVRAVILLCDKRTGKHKGPAYVDLRSL
jgi:RNA-binding protein 39